MSSMRLASYAVGGEPRAAVLAADQTLVPVSDLLAEGPSSMLDLLETLARHTSDSLELGRLLDRLRQEAATNEHLALHDVLTGLPNRVWFLQRLDEAIQEVSDGSLLAVILMDLDRFKEVNDTLGHHNGDELLKEMGRRLGELVQGHAVARLGGDEFAVLLSKIPGPQAALSRAREMVRSLEAPFEKNAYSGVKEMA